MAGDDADELDKRVKRRRRVRGRAATNHERAARAERDAAYKSDLFGDAEAAEDHRDAARRHEADADDERRDANHKR